MNPRTFLFLFVALAAAGGTAWIVNARLSERPTAAAPPPVAAQAAPTVEILVAKSELLAGAFIKSEHLMWQTWPEESVVEDYLVKGKATEKELEGSVVRGRLHPGEPITRRRVVQPGERGFLAAVVEPGKRAVSVPVDGTRGVSGFVFPGDHVDVLLSLKRDVTVEDEGSGSSETRYFSQTVLTDVRVLGIDQSVDNQGNAAKLAKTATLEVSPKQAEKIAVALEIGELSLSLRSVGRQEIDLPTLTRQSQLVRQNGISAESYTRDSDVLSMIGDPLGLPAPGGSSTKITLMRGSEAIVIRY